MIETPIKSALAIRPLTINQLPLCLPFGPAFMKEKNLPGEFSPETFLKNWTLFLSAYPAVIFGLWKDEALVGGIGGIMFPDLNTGVMCAIEFFWYVDPAYRNTLGAARLPMAYEKWGKAHGAKRFRMIRLLSKGESPHDAKLDRFYTKTLKMTPMEVCFDKEL